MSTSRNEACRVEWCRLRLEWRLHSWYYYIVRVLVVLPTYNEAENIEAIIRAVKAALGDSGDVLVVDDGSPDGTASIVDRLATELRGIHIIRRPSKEGLGSAYRAGFSWGLNRSSGAEGPFDAMVEMDSDFSHDPAAIPRLLEPLEGGYDLCIGSRYVPGGDIPGWPWYRWLISRGGNIYAEMMLRLGVKDSTSGFRAYSSRILGSIDLSAIKAEGYGFQIEMAMAVLDAGGKTTEVPITFVDRVAGTSKMSSRIFVEAFALVTWWSMKKVARKARERRRAGLPSGIRA